MNGRCKRPGIGLFVFLTFSGYAGSVAEDPTTRPAASAPADWPHPRTDERRLERERMVEGQIKARGVRSSSVLDAMRNVPRHWFLPADRQDLTYYDQPVPIGEDQTISQPYIVALMTEALEVKEGDKVLEVGTGSGYQAAVLAELTPHVYSIEIVKPLAERAARTFQERGYTTIQTRCGDGYAGWPEAAPFDAIIVTCAASRVPSPLVEQLKPGGRMCIPVGESSETQRLLLITRQANGLTTTKNLEFVRFVPMTGKIDEKR